MRLKQLYSLARGDGAGAGAGMLGTTGDQWCSHQIYCEPRILLSLPEKETEA